MYEIIYDYTDESGNEFLCCTALFEGTRSELQAYVKQMRKTGCRNITYTEVREAV